MGKQLRPMLASNSTMTDIEKRLEKGPLWCSPKIDGIRAIVHNGRLLSRTLKPIRNTSVQKRLGNSEFNGLDGELICGSPTAEDVFRKTTSAVMSQAGTPDVWYFVFDTHDLPGVSYQTRYRNLEKCVAGLMYIDYRVKVLETLVLSTPTDILEYEKACLSQGYEGIILRCPDAMYKFGRSTLLEAGMLKLKRFIDSEAKILKVEELMHNENPAETDALGLTKRTSHKENKVPGDTMGKLLVEDLSSHLVFSVGTGFDAAERDWFWERKLIVPGQIIKYKYLQIGVKDLPRHPVYLGLRDKDDIS